MGLDSGFGVNQRKEPATAPGPPFAAGSALNGLSLDGSGRVVLGGGAAAVLLSNREIPMAGFNLQLSGGTGNLLIGTTADNAKGRLQVNGNASFLNGNLFMETGLFGPNIHSTGIMTYFSDANLNIFQGVAAGGVPEIRMTAFNATIVSQYAGVINGFNFNASSTVGQDFLIVSSGFNTVSNGTSGNIVLRTNVLATNIAFPQFQNGDWSIIMEPSRDGVVRITRANNTPRLQLLDTGSLESLWMVKQAFGGSLFVDAGGGATTMDLWNATGFVFHLGGASTDGSLVMVNGTQSVYGSQYDAAVTVLADTLLDDTFFTVFVDATAGNVTITLPSAAGSFKTSVGKRYNIVKVDAGINTVTVAAGGGDTINGAASVLSAVFVPVNVQSAGGTKWFTV